VEFTIEFQLLNFSKKKVDQFALIEMSQVYFLKLQPVIFFNASTRSSPISSGHVKLIRVSLASLTSGESFQSAELKVLGKIGLNRPTPPRFHQNGFSSSYQKLTNINPFT